MANFAMPWGGPRFYPPGEHPAAHQWRRQRREVAALLDSNPLLALTDPDIYRNACEMLAHVEQRLAEFEAGEDEAKRRAWRRT